MAVAFARIAGLPPGPSRVLDTDLATTLQADKVFHIDGTPPSILHLEFESNPRLGIPRELMRYNTMIDNQHDCPVASVLVLLRPKAVASDQTGTYERFGADGTRIAEFRYRVFKVWEQPFDYWLDAGTGLSPLAMLTDEAGRNLERALDGFQNTIRKQVAEPGIIGNLMNSAFTLCGLRYDENRLIELFRSMTMVLEDSTTYQYLIRRGRNQGVIQGERNVLLRQGTKRFGAPDAATLAAIESIDDPVVLDRLAERILDALSWADLLAAK